VTKYVYFFGAGRAEGSSVMRNLLGGKGCELAEMTNLGIPVPPGFTITTQAWVHAQRAGGRWPEGLWEQILEHLERLEQVADARFGDRERPLLVSVRSGARVSMPGMMETILNLGLNDATVEGLAARSGNERFAWDCYRRFITMFSVVVLDIKREVFDALLDAMKTRLGAAADADVPASALRELVKTYQDEIATRTGAPFPQDVRDQLGRAINAVFGSWFAKKATEYRRIHAIPEDWARR
jgi:pyruvate,orthophosphate dikinase